MAFDPELWPEVSGYLDEVLSLPEAQRGPWLDSFRSRKPQMADLLHRLLDDHRALSNEHFLEELPDHPVTSLAGQTVGSYRLLRNIGRGGMGDVWVAERSDGRFEKQVAVKLLRVAVATDGGAGRFKREGRILAQLAHPNIAELIDAGVTADGRPYLVLEHVRGNPITEYCDDHKLSIGERIRLFLDVLSAVARAHASLVVHRDIKPSNVLVSDTGQVKLLDFGIAKLLPEKADIIMATQLTAEGIGALTPQFAAPEQITGATITTAVDIYALGLLLYLLLTGRHPVDASTTSAAELVKAIVEIEPLRPSDAVTSADSTTIAGQRSTTTDKLRRQLRGDLDTIVGKMLKKNPAERYSSVISVADDLDRFLRQMPIAARPDTLSYRAAKFARRHRLGLALAALAVTGTAVAIIAVKREARRAEARFQQVRKLAHTVLFELNPEIENLSGSTKARELLVNTSLEYLDSLAKESGNDSGLQLELATAYAKIGDVQGNAKYSNLGHPDAALQSYDKAIAIAQKVRRSPEALELIANTYSEIGSVQVMQLGLRTRGRESLRLAATIADSLPSLTGRPYYRERVLAYGYLGDIDEIYDPTRAAEPLRHALDLSAEWSHEEPGPEPLFLSALFIREKADIFWGTGNLTAARDTLLQALDKIKQAMALDPANADGDRERVLILERLGLVSGDPDYFNLGDQHAATDWLYKDVQECEHRVTADPRDQRAQLDLGQALAELAGAYRDVEPQKARQLYERSLDTSNRALQTDPDDADILTWQSFARIWFATNLQRLGEYPRALTELSSAVNAAKRVVERDHASIPARQLLGIALYSRAHQLILDGDLQGAEHDLQQSEQVLATLRQENPKTLLFLRDLADCYKEQGQLAARRSDWQTAKLRYERSADLWSHWTEIGSSSVYDQRRLQQAFSLVRRAEQHLHP
jgi:serine/threonine protein kinase/tetratricopeptide (TPR) repeat protein